MFRPLVLLLLCLTACGDRDLPVHVLSGSAMGTVFSVKIVPEGDPVDENRLGDAITAMLGEIEQRMSTYIGDSELSRFNRNPSTDWIRVSTDLCNLVAKAKAISGMTDGAFDITVGPLVNLWGFGPDGSIDSPPAESRIAETLARTGYRKLHADCSAPALRKERADLYVDLSAIAKGHAADRISALLDGADIRNYLVEIGGELRMRGLNAKRSEWAIAIETPRDEVRQVQTIIHLTDLAMATSGDYRNFFEHLGRRYSHTIDPGTGQPVTHRLAAVTVVSDSAAVADAWATALLVLGPERGYALAERENMAAYFLLRGAAGPEELTTSAFEALRST